MNTTTNDTTEDKRSECQRNARKHPREEVTLRVDYMDAEGHSGLGLAKNLSLYNRHRTHVARDLGGGRHADPDVRHLARESLYCNARVVQTLRASAGLVFTDAKEAYRQLLGEIAAAFRYMPGDAPLWRTSHRALRVRG